MANSKLVQYVLKYILKNTMTSLGSQVLFLLHNPRSVEEENWETVRRNSNPDLSNLRRESKLIRKCVWPGGSGIITSHLPGAATRQGRWRVNNTSSTDKNATGEAANNRGRGRLAAGCGGCAAEGFGFSAYREPGAWCHCNEPTCRIWCPPEPRKWRSVSARRGPRERREAPWGASCPQAYICWQPRRTAARPFQACRCRSGDFSWLRVAVDFHQTACKSLQTGWKVCSHWGIAAKEECRGRRSAAHGRALLLLH